MTVYTKNADHYLLFVLQTYLWITKPFLHVYTNKKY